MTQGTHINTPRTTRSFVLVAKLGRAPCGRGESRLVVVFRVFMLQPPQSQYCSQLPAGGATSKPTTTPPSLSYDSHVLQQARQPLALAVSSVISAWPPLVLPLLALRATAAQYKQVIRAKGRDCGIRAKGRYYSIGLALSHPHRVLRIGGIVFCEGSSYLGYQYLCDCTSSIAGSLGFSVYVRTLGLTSSRSS